MNLINEIQKGVKNLKQDQKELEKFAVVMSSALLIIAVLVFALTRNPGLSLWLFGFTILLILSALFYPSILKPFYKIWMIFALLLGAIMSRVFLTLFFYLIITPIGIMLRLLGKDMLYMKWPGKASSYWLKRLNKGKGIDNYKRSF